MARQNQARAARRSVAGGPLAACALAGIMFLLAGEATAPAATPATAIVDVAGYLAQLRCGDGSLPLLSRCGDARPQRAADRMLWRRADRGNPNPPGYYQVSDSVVADDGKSWITTWSYPPFGQFVAADGDGGEVYVREGNAVRIDRTQDGGRPGMQYFVGTGCGGTGWIAFRDDAPTGRWATLVATLADRPRPDACGHLTRAFTRYRLETVTFPFIVAGRKLSVTLPTIISDHCNAGTLSACNALERSYFARGWGRLYWAAWGPQPARVDLSSRCPPMPFDAPPVAGWHREDCRLTTQIITATGRLSVDRYGWPPRRQ